MSEITDLNDTDSANTSVSGNSVDGNIANMSTMDDVIQSILGLLSRSLRSSIWRLKDGTDATKKLAFNIAGLTTATTRTLTVPDKNGTVAMLDDITTGATTAKMDSRPSLIVNGNFQMSQENGTTLGTANNFYFADQFFLSFAASTAAMSVQLLTSVRTLSGNDRVGEFKTTTAKASLGATDFVTLSTVIEGSRPEWKAAAFGTAGAKPFVYRFEFTGPAGLYHMHFQNSAGNRHCAVPFTVAAPEANVATVRALILPADTTGTWLFGDGDKGLVCDLVLAAGATLTGGTASTWGATARLAATTQFNILSSTSNVARIADVGLKNDPDATGVYGPFNLMEQNPVYRSERYDQYVIAAAGGDQTASGETFYAPINFFTMSKTPTPSAASVLQNANVGSTAFSFITASYLRYNVFGSASPGVTVSSAVRLNLRARL